MSQTGVAALDASRISKTYGKGSSAFLALRDVSVRVERGESLAIVGRSGSGKSTLMHVLALLDAPDSGVIEIGGTDVSRIKSRELNRLRNRHYGFVFQQFFLNARQSVLENVMLPLVIAGVRPAERRRRALAALEAVDLVDKANNRASDLSGGQKQRVVVARAIANDPLVIFADEPTGNLDSRTGAQVEALLTGLNRDKGMTLVVVTHDEEFAKTFDRQIHLRDGVIVSDSKAELAGVRAEAAA